MAAIFDNDMQWSSANLDSHISTEDKFRFVEVNTLVRPEWHQAQKWALMLSTRDAMLQEQAV
ncbi:MAG: hypothetical protein FT714_03575 [Pantoea sp. Pent]|nr:hypothetical protein [Pantoea sp. Pent]